MTKRIVILALSLVFLRVGVACSDETLTEAAEREKARRAGQNAKTVKKFTDDDLKKLPGKRPSGVEASAPDTSAPVEGEGIPASQDPSQPEYWRPQVDAARTELRSREAAVRELEARIAELRADISRPVRIGEANRDGRIAHDIAAVAGELETARQAVEKAQQALEDVLEEARRAGVSASQLE